MSSFEALTITMDTIEALRPHFAAQTFLYKKLLNRNLLLVI